MLILHAAFVLTGVVTTLLGPILPLLVARWGLTDPQAGLLFTMQFAGSMAGVGLSSAVMTRLGRRATLVAGMTLMAGGVAALEAATPALGYAAVFCYGTGLGLNIPTTNLVVAARQPERSAAALSLLNLAWGIGAVSAPPVIAALHHMDAGGAFLIGLAAALALMSLALARLRVPGNPARPDSVRAPVRWWNRSVLVAGGTLFVYVGTETALAGWIAVYAQRQELMTAAGAVAAPSFFWGALLAGRAMTPVVLRYVDEVRLIAWSLLLAATGIGVLLAAGSASVLAIAVAIGGLGLATVFPITVALFTRDAGPDSTRLAAPVFALAGLGGAGLPPLVGIVSAQSGSLKAGLFVPLLGCLIMLALQGGRGRLTARTIECAG